MPQHFQLSEGDMFMRLRNLFTPVHNMSTQQLQAYIDSNQEGSYTLLDVRQPEEYESTRIPGSKLLPLPSLDDRLDELDPQKPVIAY
jgi:rhodanese-related sulfurtransferase